MKKTSWIVGREAARSYIDSQANGHGPKAWKRIWRGKKESKQIASGGVEGPRKARRYRLALVCMWRYFAHPLPGGHLGWISRSGAIDDGRLRRISEPPQFAIQSIPGPLKSAPG